MQQALYEPKFKLISTIDVHCCDSVHYQYCVSPDQKIVKCEVLASLPTDGNGREISDAHATALFEELDILCKTILSTLYATELDLEYDFSSIQLSNHAADAKLDRFPMDKGVTRIAVEPDSTSWY